MNLIKMTADSFQNFAARLGLSAKNQNAASTYGFEFLSRDRIKLEAMYRGSWIVGQVVDCVADDMTREGIKIKGDMPPEDIAMLHENFAKLKIWDAINDTIKWSRLYGGAIAVMLIDGQDASKPLQIDSIAKGQFKGLLTLDRWMVQPTLNELVTDYCPDLGMPKFYDVMVGAPALQGKRVHYSRIIRIDGVELPHWQRIAENLWGQSVIERLLDRLIAFDSTTTGAAQLVYKAHLRTYKVKNLRAMISNGGPVMEAFYKQMDMIRQFQSNEGMTLMDADDTFEAHQYSFSGLSDMLLQFGQQLSGATQIPLVRLFGQSPAGLNSTGESDLKNYYDTIKQQQERRLRSPIERLLMVLCWSVLGKDQPQGFGMDFTSLWQMSDTEKADVASKHTDTVLAAEEAGLIDRHIALKELRQSSEVTGVWTNITDEDINAAKDDPPPPTDGPDDERQSE